MKFFRYNFLTVATVTAILTATGWGVMHIAIRDCWRCDKKDFWERGLEFACDESPSYRANSMRFIETAAEQGEAEAVFFLAELSLGEANGTEIQCLREKVPVSREKAVELFIRLEGLLAQQKNPPADICTRIGALYMTGVLPSGAPDKDAEKWFLKAAEGNSIYAMHALGMIYDSHDNYNEALKWLQKAAEAGNLPNAALTVGDYFFYGKGIDTDYHKAVEWYGKAIDYGKKTYARLADDELTKILDPAYARMEIAKQKISDSGGATPLVIHYRLDGGSSDYQVFTGPCLENRAGRIMEKNGAITAAIDSEIHLPPDMEREKNGFEYMNQGLYWVLDAFARSKYGNGRTFMFRLSEKRAACPDGTEK